MMFKKALALGCDGAITPVQIEAGTALTPNDKEEDVWKFFKVPG